METNRKPRQKSQRRIEQEQMLTRILTVAFICAALITAVLAFRYVRSFTQNWNLTELEGVSLQQPTQDNSGAPADPANVQPLPEGEEIDDVRAGGWDGGSRVTVLVMGLDYRDWEVGNDTPRTDSMILLTFDPVTNSAGMLSLPRDLWVNIPGFGYGKINTAYQNGEAARLPGGGPELAMRTVEEFLGIKIDYYAQIDFNTFAQFIDYYEGIRLTPTENIVIPDVIGREKPLRLKAGERVTLWGQEALAYVRYRKTEGGDFDRARRQQEMLFALRDKLLEPNWFGYSVTHAGELWDLFSGGIRTNLTINEIIQVGYSARNIDVANINTGVISPPNMVTLEKSPDGLDILKPITANIRILRDEIFTTNSHTGPSAAGANLPDLVAAEAATVAVFNGTLTAGLAGSTQEYLIGQGVNVTEIGNADLIDSTTIYVYHSKPYTMQYIVEIMGISPNRIFFSNNPDMTVDIEVVIGGDWFVPSE